MTVKGIDRIRMRSGKNRPDSRDRFDSIDTIENRGQSDYRDETVSSVHRRVNLVSERKRSEQPAYPRSNSHRDQL